MKNLILLLGLSLLLAACLKEKTEPIGNCGTIVSYSAEIRPIIENSCKTQTGPGTGCHDAWIDDYSQIKGLIDNQSWQNRTLSILDMPEIPNVWGIDSLTSDELKAMRCWIDQGYAEN